MAHLPTVPRRRRRTVVAAAGAALLAALLHPMPVEGRSVTEPSEQTQPILPMPQAMSPRSGVVNVTDGVRIVTGEDVDRPALQSLETLLAEYGVSAEIVGGPGGSNRTEIVLGGPAETPASVDALEAFGVEGPEDLPDEGYVLVAGRDERGRARIVLSGVDGAGTFYAVQSLRQLLTKHGSGARVRGVEIRDWPAYRVRGGMESFYGPVWSQADRRSQIEFLARHKMNLFFYGPADDVRTGTEWDLLYEPDELNRLQEIVGLARDRHVEFVYRVSPEAPLAPKQGICHSRESDRQKLLDRFEQLWDIGVRSFVIAWDDVPGDFVCEEDRAAYGDDPSPLAAAQTDVTNFMYREFIATHPGAIRLVTVPTEYWGLEQTTYRTRFDELLNPEIDIYWTGPGVVSASITSEDLASAQAAFPRHRLMIWDNYPVNDYIPNRLLLGPLMNRDPAMADEVVGITYNELVRDQQASQIPLGTQADYSWNPEAYDPERSWTKTLQILGGEAYPELRLFAENNRPAQPFDTAERPELAAQIERLIADYAANLPIDRQPDQLDRELRRMENLPRDLRTRLDDELMLSQIGPWLDRIGVTGQVGRAALDILRAQDRGKAEAAWRARREQARLRGILDESWHLIAPGPIDRLLDFAASQSDGYIGHRWYNDLGEPTGAPAAADGSSLAALADRRADTAYVAAGRPEPGDAVTVPITKPHRLESVTVVQSPDDPARGMIQAHVGERWIDLGRLDDGFTTVPGRGVEATAVRIRWATGTEAPRIYEVVPQYADVFAGRVGLDPPGALIAAGATKRLHVEVEAFDTDRITGRVSVTGPDGWTFTPAERTVRIRPDGRTMTTRIPLDVTVPSGTPDGRHEIVVTFQGGEAEPVEFSVPVLVGDAAYPDLVSLADPVGYWRLSEPAGTDLAVDSSSTGQDGVYRDGAQPGAPSALAGDTAADLSTGYIEVERTEATNLTGPFTLEAWVKLDTIAPSPGQAIIESYTAPATNGFVLRIDNGAVQAWSLGSPGQGFGLVTGRTRLTPGEWHHVAAVYDGSQLTVYLDGQADGSAATAISPGSGTATIKLGARGDDTAQRLLGDLDEAAIYDRALTATEIEQHYLTGVS